MEFTRPLHSTAQCDVGRSHFFGLLMDTYALNKLSLWALFINKKTSLNEIFQHDISNFAIRILVFYLINSLVYAHILNFQKSFPPIW